MKTEAWGEGEDDGKRAAVNKPQFLAEHMQII